MLDRVAQVPAARASTLPARVRRALPGSRPARRRIGDAYRIHFDDPRRERMFLSSVGFLMTFAGARAVTHAIRDDALPIGNISSGGRHIHHCVFGITGLLATGYAWTAQLGTGDGPGSRASATIYGIAAALTLDEFALWLDMEDDYWTKEGRKSVDAVLLFAGLLSAGTWGAPFFGGLVRRARGAAG